MPLTRRTYVSLTGGLGNQLFQLARGLSSKNSSKLILSAEYGAPRVSSIGKTEIASFRLPPGVEIANEKRATLLIRKAVGFTLRSSIYPSALEKRMYVPQIAKFLTSILISFEKRQIILVNTAIEGEKLKNSNFSEILVGYFQNSIAAQNERVISSLMQIKPLECCALLKEFIEHALNTDVLIVHVRLGDYRNEPSFGILPKEYYLTAINHLFKLKRFEEIWVFSDEPTGCIGYVPPEYLQITKFITQFQDNASKNFELMRHGAAYVIANSTYSWWAAQLAYKNLSGVIYPDPWFLSRKLSNNFFPEHWTPIKR